MKARPHMTRIESLTRAMERAEAAFDAMEREWEEAGALCCPNCMWGSTWTRACEKQDRRALLLGAALWRRNAPGDRQQVKALDMDYPELLGPWLERMEEKRK